jgi:hypothetical protein
MSRSFADEVCNIIDDMKEKSFLFTNQNEDVKNMLMKVQESRSRERKRGTGNAKLYDDGNFIFSIQKKFFQK